MMRFAKRCVAACEFSKGIDFGKTPQADNFSHLGQQTEFVTFIKRPFRILPCH